MFYQGNNIMIELINRDDQAPFRVHGKFQAEDEECIKVIGTVGNDIGKSVIVPKANIKTITLL